MRSLASGSRFDNYLNDSADQSIAEELRGQISGVKAGKGNAENAQSFIQVAEGGLNEQNNILIRMRELAVQAASDTFSDSERGFLNSEFSQLAKEVDRIAQTTQFGSTHLLTGNNKTYDFQVGPNGGSENIIKFKSETDTRANSLGVGGLDVESTSSARDSLQSLDDALTQVAGARANYGAIQSRLDSAINHAAGQAESLQAAHSRIADTDVAEATSQMYKSQALQQYQISVLNEANRFPGSILRLIA